MDARGDERRAGLDLAAMMRRALEEGVPFLTLGGGTAREVAVCLREAGGEIGHPGCADVSVALEGGVLMRCPVTSGGARTGWAWLRACGMDGLEGWVRHRFEGLSAEERDEMCVDAAFQSMRHEDAAAGAARRARPGA